MKLKQTLLAFTLLIGAASSTSFASPLVFAATCGGVETSVVSCAQTGGCEDGSDPALFGGKCKDGSEPKVENTGLWGLLMLIINILSAGVGIAAVGGVVYGSVLYTTAGGSLDQVKKSRMVIANTVVGIIAYVLLYALLNYLIPGGLFS